MTPSQKVRHGCEAARNTKWKLAAAPAPLLKRPSMISQPKSIQPHPAEHVYRSHFPLPPPNLPLFHTRHAEESAERPRLVTIVRPCQSTLRKVTVLLNRRGVVSFEQLLLDISEALGFPRWHRARVTRLYTTHAREVKGVCDFFRGETALLALSKARPELSSVQEALEELFPEHSHYRANALRAWEKKLQPPPDKTAKADSGYSEGTDNIGTNQDVHRNTNTHVKNHINTHTSKKTNMHQPDNHNPDSQKSYKKNYWRKPLHLPNNLQRLHVRGGITERQPSVIGPFKHEEGLIDADIPPPILCENCLVRQAKHKGPELITTLSGRVPLPPVSRKQKGSSHIEQEVKHLDVHNRPPHPQPINRGEERSLIHLQLLNPAPKVGAAHTDAEKKETSGLPFHSSEVTLSDIERCYEIGPVVGDGNFAVVRECRRRDNGQTLAVKIIEHSKLIGREHMMQNELSLLGSLCHPRIVRLLTHYHTHTHFYLFMELVNGGDLFEAISDRGKFSEAEAGLMVSDVSEALNYIHCKSIVHRDLKPENLLIEEVASGISRLKLADFGLAMVVTEPVYTICGTPTYVAPEILCETGYDVAVDVWALGVILYILLCGFPPFRSRDRDQEELFKLIKQAQLHFPSPYWDSISDEAKSLVRSLLQPDPTVRLTAEQTLLHQWVTAMASTCRQRALTDKPERSMAAAEPVRVQRPTVKKAAESLTDKSMEPFCSEEEITLRRHDKLTARGKNENKQPLQQSEETSTVDVISPKNKEHSPLDSTHGQEKLQSSSTEQHSGREIQDPGPKLLNTNHIDLTKLDSSATQTEPPSQIKPQLKHDSQQQSPPNSTSLIRTTHQTTAGRSAHLQQNINSQIHNPMTATSQKH
ncbi:serine/threonine-protein kinase DCLK3 [Melanotaenia boesemani]|uniref:serine/threonine-protein kinase DCLK3 n=1 Tax=Melanotaenia boesemani TaxID=1250792 RepID=UPI001C04D4E7|nr:serine/threonine-protein kinase DCLK3 [Melanotaenia boesemani]